jgi:hypothetical protein
VWRKPESESERGQVDPPVAGWVAELIATIETLRYGWKMSNWQVFVVKATVRQVWRCVRVAGQAQRANYELIAP